MNKLTIILAFLMMLSTPALADTTDEKLDLILEKLTDLSAKYDKSFEGTEAFKEFEKLLNGLFLDYKPKSQDTPKNQKITKDVVGNDFLEVVDWSATKGEAGFTALGTVVKIKLTIRNKSNRKIALVDGSYDITDKLGKNIIRFGVDSDLNIGPNETYNQSGAYDAGMQFSGDLKRLLTINPNLIEFNFDLKQILFEDGTKLSFD